MHAAKTEVVLTVVSFLVSYVRQEPIGGKVASEPLAARSLVSRRGDREKLGALDIAALRIGDLLARGAAALPSRRHVAEAHVAAAPGHLGRALAHAMRSPARVLRPREVPQILVRSRELGTPDGRGCGAEAQPAVEARARRIVGTPPDRDDVHARRQPFAADDGNRRVGARGANVSALARHAPFLARGVVESAPH